MVVKDEGKEEHVGMCTRTVSQLSLSIVGKLLCPTFIWGLEKSEIIAL